MFRDLSFDLISVVNPLVDLSDGNDDRCVTSFGVVDGFNGLLFDTIICCDYDDDNISDLTTSCSQRREKFVTWRIDKRDFFMIFSDLTSSDALSDTSLFFAGDLSTADIIQQCRLTVIDVSHHRDDRWSVLSKFTCFVCF